MSRRAGSMTQPTCWLTIRSSRAPVMASATCLRYAGKWPQPHCGVAQLRRQAHMTIRDYLRKKKRAGIVVVIAYLVFFFSLPLLSPEPMPDWLRWSWLLLIPCAPILGVWFQYSIRCPQCSSFLSTSISIGKLKILRPIRYCPYCAVDLDSPLQE
jgi:hypothetical protein